MSVDFLLDIFKIKLALNLVIILTCLGLCGIILLWRIK